MAVDRPAHLDENMSEPEEVNLQDLGIFDEDLPPVIRSSQNIAPSNPANLAGVQNVALSQSVAVREPLVVSERDNESEYVEIETLPGDDLTGKLACAICYQPFYPEHFTVVSKERLNFEAAVVVCPDCLSEMQAEVKRRTVGADLTLGAIWGAVATFIITTILAGIIWSQRETTNHIFWSWIQAFIAVLPGWFIAKAIFIGVGRKASISQQFMALGFTLLSIFIQYYVTQVAYTNFLDEITQPDGHPFEGFSLIDALQRLMPGIFNTGPLIAIAILATSFIGLATAWFVCEGPRLYTRPFVQTAKIKKSRFAQFRQFLNV